jgi:iron complex outermembrane receptor protein
LVFFLGSAALVLCSARAFGQSAQADSARAQSEPAPSPTQALGAEAQMPAATVLAAAQPEQVLVTARRREELAQDVPLALTVVPVEKLDLTGNFNVAGLSQLAPSVQFSSSNGRNTAITIRGLGTSFGLANDGLESGVGVYIDDVYQSRPAAATFDFIDVSQVEILRGPQGTLFGKNTTAGAITISIKKPTFDREIEAEVSAGNYGFWQGKASISGPLAGNVLAGRLSIGGTLRDGMIHDVTTGKDINNENNVGLRGQLLYHRNEDFSIRFVADYNHQQEACCGLGIVGIGTTLKPPAQQFAALAAQAGYAPLADPFDRKVDLNTQVQANQTIGGLSAIADWNLGTATITSITAWRTWNWDPLNDRDYTKLSIMTVSSNFDNQNQYSQELRIASNGSNRIDYVVGLYYFRQLIDGDPVSAWGPDATRWLLTPLTLPANLLDGYRAVGAVHADTKSYAAFAQLTWNITSALHLTPGLRYTYEEKFGSYDQSVFGGNPRTGSNNASDISKLQSIARDQEYSASFDDGSPSGQVNLAYDITADNLVYASYAEGHKSGGINLAGIPVDALGNPVTSTAVIKPEEATTYEIGVKNQFLEKTLTLNLAGFINNVTNYQVNVVDSGPGALRGYLANIKDVSSRGIELDGSYSLTSNFSAYLTGSWSEGTYNSFLNGPCPLEQITASTTACNLSGRPLPGLSRWALSYGAEYRRPIYDGMGYVGIDATYRSSNYSDVSDSRDLLINGYSVVNLRAGFISAGPWEAFVWVKNVGDTRYFTYLQAQTGNSGAVAGLLGDPRTFGVTLRVKY